MKYIEYMVLLLPVKENRIIMKRIVLSIAVLLLISAASCTYHSVPRAGALPPGQAKKAYGTKSAKPFAPGQQKKQ
jgi:hypothetical protein